MSEITAPTTEQLRNKLIEQLRKTSWYQPLRMFIQGGEFTHIVQTLLNDYALGYRLTPRMKHLFRAFELTEFSTTKCVFFTEEISPYTGRHSGVAYDCSGRNRADNQLKAIHTELVATIPGSKPRNSLDHWAEQGVLLLTSELTTTIDVKRAHVELWKSWNNTLFDVFRHDLKDCVFVFIGESVHHWADRLHPDSVIFKVGIPNKNYPANWGTNIFNLTNMELIKKNKKPIAW